MQSFRRLLRIDDADYGTFAATHGGVRGTTDSTFGHHGGYDDGRDLTIGGGADYVACRTFPQGTNRWSKLPGLAGDARPSPSGRRLVIFRRTLKGAFGVLRVSPDSSGFVARVDQGQAIPGPIRATTQRWSNAAARRYSIRRASLSLSFWAKMWSILIPTWGCLSS